MSIKIKLNNDWVDTNIQAVRGVNHVNSEDVYTKQESDALFSGKISKTDIVQSTGTSTTSVMSQKAISDALSKKADQTNSKQTIRAGVTWTNDIYLGDEKYKISSNNNGDLTYNGDKVMVGSTVSNEVSLVQNTGQSTTSVMSQKAVTEISHKVDELEKEVTPIKNNVLVKQWNIASDAKIFLGYIDRGQGAGLEKSENYTVIQVKVSPSTKYTFYSKGFSDATNGNYSGRFLAYYDVNGDIIKREDYVYNSRNPYTMPSNCVLVNWTVNRGNEQEEYYVAKEGEHKDVVEIPNLDLSNVIEKFKEISLTDDDLILENNSGNLANKNLVIEHSTVSSNGVYYINPNYVFTTIKIEAHEGDVFTFGGFKLGGQNLYYGFFANAIAGEESLAGGIVYDPNGFTRSNTTVPAPSGTNFLIIDIKGANSPENPYDTIYINRGDKVLPYKPYSLSINGIKDYPINVPEIETDTLSNSEQNVPCSLLVKKEISKIKTAYKVESPRRPRIAIMLDGMNHNHEQDIIDIANQKGVCLTLCPLRGYYTQLQKVELYKKYESEGHSMEVHSANKLQTSADTSTDPVNPEQALQIIKESIEFPRHAGFDVNILVGAYGLISDEYKILTKRFFNYACGGSNKSGSAESNIMIEENRLGLWRYSMELSTLEQQKAAVDRCISLNGQSVLLLYGHADSNVEGNDPSNYFTKSNFSALLDYINSKVLNGECEVCPASYAINELFKFHREDL